jgi:hypothetical protein
MGVDMGGQRWASSGWAAADIVVKVMRGDRPDQVLNPQVWDW